MYRTVSLNVFVLFVLKSKYNLINMHKPNVLYINVNTKQYNMGNTIQIETERNQYS